VEKSAHLQSCHAAPHLKQYNGRTSTSSDDGMVVLEQLAINENYAALCWFDLNKKGLPTCGLKQERVANMLIEHTVHTVLITFLAFATRSILGFVISVHHSCP
jgi:hypothetical protein